MKNFPFRNYIIKEQHPTFSTKILCNCPVNMPTDRPPGTCGSGYQFYLCDKNKFRGCCKVDPCDLPNCPETESHSIVPSTTSLLIPTSSSLQLNVTVAASSQVNTEGTRTSILSITPTNTTNDKIFQGKHDGLLPLTTTIGIVAGSVALLSIFFLIVIWKIKQREEWIPRNLDIVERPAPNMPTKPSPLALFELSGKSKNIAEVDMMLICIIRERNHVHSSKSSHICV